MKKTGKKYAAFVLTAVTAGAILWNCGRVEMVSAAEARVEAGETVGAEGIQEYRSKDGWKISYNANSFAVNDTLGDGSICFHYTGESGGTDAVIVSYVADQMPDAVLYEKVADVNDAQVQRSEGRFASSSYWAHTRTVVSEKEDPEAGDAVTTQYTAIEHNGGSVLVEIMMHAEAEEEKQMAVSDAIAELVDTFELTDHEPQTEYAYMIGTYVREYTEETGDAAVEMRETVVFNEDHTCELDFQDTVAGEWTGEKIILGDGSEIEFTVEGDSLFLDMFSDGEWIEFARA